MNLTETTMISAHFPLYKPLLAFVLMPLVSNGPTEASTSVKSLGGVSMSERQTMMV